MKITKPLIILTLFLFNFYIGFSQLNIKGRVIDSNQKPIEKADVVLLNHQENVLKEVLTDSLGLFNLEYKEIGDYKIEISYIGFEPIIIPIKIVLI